MAKPSKQQIASVRSALREIHAELIGWGPHLLVSFNDEAHKTQIVVRLRQLGWHYVDEPGSETAEAGIAEFSLEPAPLATTTPSARPDSTGVRRGKQPASFFASFSIFFALLGIIFAITAFYTNYRMGLLNKAGTLTTGEVERTYVIPGRRGGHYVSYRFVDGHGISHEGDQPYPFQDWGGLRGGAPISITYLADDPKQNDLTLRLITDRSPTEKMILFGVPWIIAGCFLLGYWARRRRF